MKTGLLMSVASVVAVGAAVGGAVGMICWSAEAWAACTTSPNCESLGYKYCASECPNGSVACPFDSNKRFCFSPKPYTVTAESCAAQCLNGGSQSCIRGEVTYYNACGSSKCKSGEECKNGTCVSTCNYTVTAATCTSQCLNVGTKSCTKNGTTYYESCGSSKCSSGQTCSGGTCKTVPTSGACCGYRSCPDNNNYCQSNYGENCYSKCIRYYPDCNDMQASCRTQGGTPVFQKCYSGLYHHDVYYPAIFACEICNYTETAATCSSQCKNVGTKSCTKNGTTYYESCGSSKCSSGQTCENGACVPMVVSEACCDDTGNYCGDYSKCKSYWNEPDCSDIIASCRSQGGTSDFQGCNAYKGSHGGGPDEYFYAAVFVCN